MAANKIKSENLPPDKKRTQVLCAFVYENANLPKELEQIDKKLDGVLAESLNESGGEQGSISVVNTFKKIPAKKVLLIGLGEKKKITLDSLRMAASDVANKLKKMEIREYSVLFPPYFDLDTIPSVQSIVEGIEIGLYSFEKFKTTQDKQNEKKKRGGQKPFDISVLMAHTGDIDYVIKRAQTIAESVKYTRDIANLPANHCTPETLASFARNLARKFGLKCTIMTKKEIQRRGMGGITAVGAGSKNEPRLVILEYNGSKQKEDQKPIIVVGKAVTFDTGGISLKPADNMQEMKFDKCGGCNVFGILRAVASLKLASRVVGIIPCVENMPGGQAYRPGDIIQFYNKKTAEIQNTDAEGRLILADALAYANKHYSPKFIVDFATLTGACVVAFGNNIGAVLGNNDKLIEKIMRSSDRTGEQVWRLPLNDDYLAQLKSKVADMRNIGGRPAGTITAAGFLSHAVKEDIPWAHFDIAGTAWVQEYTKKKSYNQNGATAFGVRLITDLLSKEANGNHKA